jgi:hypothetical protein
LENNEYVAADTILRYLTELKTLRESALRPATKYLNATPYKQFRHFISEVKETIKEAKPRDGALLFTDKDRLAEELVDVKMSAETMLAILGLDADQRNAIRLQVIEKNRVRHYYEVSAK